jgi:AcrR family transcriptional regulator
MPTSRKAVKPARTYDSSSRRLRAQQSRGRIIETAERRFLADGYAATSLAAVADEAAVSVDTIYKAFGGKPGLARAIVERALEGVGPVPAATRSDRLQAEEKDPRRLIEGWGRMVAELAPRGAPIGLLIRDAAATATELRELIDEMDDARLRRMTANARRLHTAGHLRRGVTVSAAADVLWTYSSLELYELLVLKRKMPIARYGRFVADAMIAALL